MTEKTTGAVVYRGVRIEPNFKSTQTGRPLLSQRGWYMLTPPELRDYKGRRFASSLKSAKKEIDRLCDDVQVRAEVRVAMLQAAGESERAERIAFIHAAKVAADMQAEADAAAQRAKAEALADAAPDMLAFIQKCVAEYVPSQHTTTGPVYPEWHAQAMALIAKAGGAA